MATIVRTPSGTWKAVVRKRGWPTESKTFRLKVDAQDWARQTEDAMVRGTFITRSTPSKLTLSKALSQYLEEVTSQKKPTTKKAEEKTARALTRGLGSYSLAALTAKRITEYREERLSSGLAPDTVRLELTLLGAVIDTAMREWGISLPANPAKAVKKPAGRVRDRLLTWSEIKRLLRAAKTDSQPLIYHAIRLAMFTAMRHGEIENLRVQDIDFERRQLYVYAKAKGARKKQAVPLSARAIQVLRDAIACPARPKGSKWVFAVTEKGPYLLQGGWRRVVEQAGVEDIRIHDLRHLATTIYAKRGLTTQQLQQLTRHKTLSMLNRYSHLQASDIVDLL